MRSLGLHFLLGYAMLGALGPFFPEFLRTDRGLSASEIGVVYAAAQVCLLPTPVILAFLADRAVSQRVIAGGIYLAAAGALLALWGTAGFGATLVLFMAYTLSYAPLIPLQDGLYFAVHRQRQKEGLSAPPYHRIRVLGTVGFIVPSMLLLVLIPAGGSLEVILPVGAGFALLAALNAARLPGPAGAVVPAEARSRLPTTDAARVLFGRGTVGFCVAMALLQFANAGYYAFYPVHLAQALDVPARWLGAVSTLGVAMEALLMLAFGWMSLRLGPRRMLAVGAVLTAVRLILVAAAPSAGLAIAANVLHGPIIVGTLVAPVVFINRLAGDSFRNSIQGVFTVAVLGPARIVGSLGCGWLAAMDMRVMFLVGAALALVAAVVVVRLVADPPAEPGSL